MIDPLHRKQTPKTGEVKANETNNADKIKLPKGMENIKPNATLPQGVNLKGKDICVVDGSNKAHDVSRKTFALRNLQQTASRNPPESSDELDAVAELFVRKVEKEITKAKATTKSKDPKFKWTASTDTSNLNPKIVEEARERLTGLR